MLADHSYKWEGGQNVGGGGRAEDAYTTPGRVYFLGTKTLFVFLHVFQKKKSITVGIFISSVMK